MGITYIITTKDKFRIEIPEKYHKQMKELMKYEIGGIDAIEVLSDMLNREIPNILKEVEESIKIDRAA